MTDKHSISHLLTNIETNWPEAATLDGEVILSIIRLKNIADEKAREALAPLDLTLAGFEVLFTLRALPEPRQMTPTELYKAILITSGGMTKVLKQLEHNGWIQRLENTQDKRSKLVKLTHDGALMAEKSMALVGQSDQSMLSDHLTEQELCHLRDSLMNVLSKIEGK
ncbi:MarR family transcriptional regulator [Terasakiella sp. SH-1]|uniref:MarR family transcriptional regulator n=1 Tax=Terasakiella sp. SH-1 TaxID=2560057 RepID=UPI0014302932|nr:MarR family transcriptional regulator [Terasakiella sp. SH-1]